MATTNSPKNYTHAIHIHCNEEMYENFQRLRRQTGESSDASLGRKIIKQYLTEELDGAGTQRHFQATYQEHLRKIEWLLGLILTANGTTLAEIGKQTGQAHTTRQILHALRTGYVQNHTRVMAEIQDLIDSTADN